jgi:hypothetical protein
VRWTDPSGQIVDDEGAGRTRCIPLVERWDPFLQACVPNLGPPPPNNRLTNDAARSYAQAFDDLVGSASRSTAPFKGGIVRRPDGTIIFVPEAEDEGEPTGGLGPGITWGIRGALLLCVAGVLAQAIGPAGPPSVPPEQPPASEQEQFIGFHGTSTVHVPSLLIGINPLFGLNTGGRGQLGPGFYTTPDIQAAVQFAQDAVNVSGGSIAVLRIYARNFAQLRGTYVEDTWWGRVPAAWITDFDFLYSEISGYESATQIKFNPRAYPYLKARLQ